MCDFVVYAVGFIVVWIVLRGGAKYYMDTMSDIESFGRSMEEITNTLTGRNGHCSFPSYPGNEIKTHVVKRGESIASIAEIYNVEISDILMLNHGVGDVLPVNYPLNIPSIKKRSIYIGSNEPKNAIEGDIWVEEIGPIPNYHKVVITEEVNDTDWLISYIDEELRREEKRK